MLDLKNVSYKVSNHFTVGPIHITINKGDHVAVIGESGCGKTTLLKVIYGLMDIDNGSIFWDDRKITGPEENLIPGMPYIKYLSQDFDLMPFTSVAENINKYLSRLEPEVSKARTKELMKVVDMTNYANAKVKTLSGGQKQRVALAQALAKEPELLLLDEPFSHIDNFRKNKLRRQLFTYLKQKNITCLVATHDSTDVLSYMDTTIVMKNGKIIAQDFTNILYNDPPSYYVGSLFGDINEVPKNWFFKDSSIDENLFLYPHQIAIANQGKSIVIENSYFMGMHYLITAKSENITILFYHNKPLELQSNYTINLI